jgi:hypothetical protein
MESFCRLVSCEMDAGGQTVVQMRFVRRDRQVRLLGQALRYVPASARL